MSKPIIAVAFYSTFGHTGILAEEVIKGVQGTGAVVRPYFIEETLKADVLEKMHAGSSLKPKYPLLQPDDLKDVDGLILGTPARFGRLPEQVSTFFDKTGGLWRSGGLVGKFVTMFTSTAGQHGGQETAFITTFPFFVHQGMVYVPIGFTNPKLGNVEVVQGGSAYGASTIAGLKGERQPTADELTIAEDQGKYFAEFVGTFVRGKQAITTPPPLPESNGLGLTTAPPPVSKDEPAGEPEKEKKSIKNKLLFCCGSDNDLEG